MQTVAVKIQNPFSSQIFQTNSLEDVLKKIKYPMLTTTEHYF